MPLLSCRPAHAFTVLLTHPGTVLGYVTQLSAVSRAALSGNMHRALAVTLLAPTAMHLQHTNIHVPFRTLILFQLGNFAVAVVWASGMPCWLSQPASSNWAAGAAPGLAIKHFLDPTYASGGSACSAAGAAADVAASLQHSAEQLCTRVRALQLLLSLLVPVSCLPGLITTQSSTPCKGPSAYQVLYLFFAAQLLLVLPLTVSYLMEWWAKSCWLNASGIAVTQKPFIFGVTRAQLESSAGSRGAGASATERGTARVLQWWLAMPLLLLLVQLPWVVAEALVGQMQGVCRPVWGARGFAWMSGLW